MRLIFLLAALALAAPVFADNHEDLVDSWYVWVKDGHDEQFEEAFKDHLKFRNKKKDARVWKTYTPVIGKNLDYYVVRYCCVSWADMDTYAAWSRKNKVNEHWNENVDPHVEKYSHYLHEVDFANSNRPEEDPGYQLFGVTRWTVKPGHGGAVDASKKMISDHAKAGWPRKWSWSDRIGGSGNQLSLVSPNMNYADMEVPEGGFYKFLSGRVGETEAGKILSDFSSHFEGSSYTVYRLVDELSMKD